MIETIKDQLKYKSLLLKCIAASLLLHIMGLYFFYKHPLALYAASFFHQTKPSPTPVLSQNEAEKLENEKTLADAFENIILLPKGMDEPYDLAYSPVSIALAPNEEESRALFSSRDQIDPVEIATEDMAFSDTQDFFLEDDEIVLTTPIDLQRSDAVLLSDNFSSVLEESFRSSQSTLPELAFIEPSQSDSATSLEENEFHIDFQPTVESFAAQKEFPSQENFVEDLSLLKTPADTAHIPFSSSEWGKREITERDSAKDVATVTERDFLVPYAHPGLSSITEDQVLELASVTTWNEDFDLTVAVAPSRDEEGGYVFSLALSPKHNMALEKINPNFYFLIDASSSVDKHRFGLFKRSVLKALSSLQEGDRFNIVVLDKKLTRLGPTNLIYNLKSLHLAEDFLDTLSQSNFLTSVDLLESLEKMAGEITDLQGMHTALLLTNGHCSQGFQNQQKALKAYLEKNSNKLSLYAAAVGNKNNLVNLDMLCSLSGGKLLYSDTNASFPRKFSALVKSLRNPIAKDLRISAVAHHPKAGLSLLTTTQHLPAMYAGEPYIIMGKMDRLSDLTLNIEARHEDEWITIQKTVSFQQADSDNTLAKEWTKASDIHTQYQGFLKDPKSKYIKEARELLKSTHGKAALE